MQEASAAPGDSGFLATEGEHTYRNSSNDGPRREPDLRAGRTPKTENRGISKAHTSYLQSYYGTSTKTGRGHKIGKSSSSGGGTKETPTCAGAIKILNNNHALQHVHQLPSRCGLWPRRLTIIIIIYAKTYQFFRGDCCGHPSSILGLDTMLQSQSGQALSLMWRVTHYKRVLASGIII